MLVRSWRTASAKPYASSNHFQKLPALLRRSQGPLPMPMYTNLLMNNAGPVRFFWWDWGQQVARLTQELTQKEEENGQILRCLYSVCTCYQANETWRNVCNNACFLLNFLVSV